MSLTVRFAGALRDAGIDLPTSAVLTFAAALDVVGVNRREGVYWAGRATLLRRPEDIDAYDRAFAVFWDRAPAADPTDQPELVSVTIALDEPAADDDDPAVADENDNEVLQVRFAATETLRHKDFALMTDQELAEVQRMMTALRLAGSCRRSRRLVPTRHHRGRPDLRRTMRATLRAGGEPIDRRFRHRSERPRQLVLLLDVSGSMEPYAQALIRFVHAAVVGRRKVEVFALGTRLTRITRELSSRDGDLALAHATDRILDWAGGTRLGDDLRQFNDRWGQRGMARGAIVVILSDGWDRGDPAIMAEQMARLARVAHCLVWVNPLKVMVGYEPLARGMAAALPYIDHFIEGHSFDAIQRLTKVISGGDDA